MYETSRLVLNTFDTSDLHLLYTSIYYSFDWYVFSYNTDCEIRPWWPGEDQSIEKRIQGRRKRRLLQYETGHYWQVICIPSAPTSCNNLDTHDTILLSTNCTSLSIWPCTCSSDINHTYRYTGYAVQSPRVNEPTTHLPAYAVNPFSTYSLRTSTTMSWWESKMPHTCSTSPKPLATCCT